MVAKSFQNLRQTGEPFSESGRMYVNVETAAGKIRKVRWYTESEYMKMYPDEKISTPVRGKTQKELFGFDNGYITIFKGNTYEECDYFRQAESRYHKIWGWYFCSTMTLPEDLPEDVEPIQLNWESVGNEDGNLKSEAEVQAAVDAIICEPCDSEYQGNIGDKLDLYLIVEKCISANGYYGVSHFHIMHDDCGNIYTWSTASKCWEEGSEHHIIGTVKDHQLYKNMKQTVLTRCREQ